LGFVNPSGTKSLPIQTNGDADIFDRRIRQ
jgi:hypothetical protein